MFSISAADLVLVVHFIVLCAVSAAAAAITHLIKIDDDGRVGWLTRCVIMSVIRRVVRGVFYHVPVASMLTTQRNRVPMPPGKS